MKKRILFLSVLTLFLSSCEIFSSLSEKTGAISIKMPEGSERIAETYDVNEITSFTAELYDSGSSPVAKVSSAPGKSITFESLTPGSYAIVIKAFKSTECAAYAEKSGIVVEAGATTYETITLFKNIIKNIESVEIAKESLDKITKNYTVGQTFALPDNVSIIAHFIHGYEKELEPNDYEIFICNAEQFAESSLVKDLPLSAKARFAAVGICTESGNKYSAPVSLVMNAEEPVVTWTIPTVKDNTISFTISASASGEISYIWEKAKTADMAGKTACTSEIEIASDGTVALPLKDESGAYVYYVCTVTNTNKDVNGTKTASKQTAVFSSQMENFTVTFNLNYDGSTNKTQGVASGSAVEKPEPPTRDGYIFGGWYTDTDCTNEYDFAIGVTADITLYAKWTVNTYTVTFNTDGGSAVDSQTVNYNSTATTPTAPTKEGYTFAGWYTDTGCTNVYDFSAAVTESITLYAKWTVNTYTVTFETNGGSAVTSQTVNYNSTATTPTAPTRNGYTFGGWYTDENCTAAYIFSTSVTADIILYAKWTEETASDTVYTDFATLKNAIGAVAAGSSGTFYVSGDIKSTSTTITVKGDITVVAQKTCTITRLSTATGIALFTVENGATLKLGGSESASLTLDGNKANCAATYPLIESAGNLEIAENCTLQNNNNTGTSKLGGAIYEYCTSGEIPTLTISGGRITGNSSSKGGGAIYILGGSSLTVKYVFSGGTISSNSTTANGGALYVKYASGTLSGTVFDSNTSTLSSATSSSGGGAIYLTGSTTMTITGGSITNNTTNAAGGGIFVNSGTLTITGTTVNISGNSCDTTLSNSECIYGSFTLNGTDYLSTNNYIINGVLQ